MKMISMKMSKEEAKADAGYPMPAPSKESVDNLPRYPYGTKVCLETEALAKLEISPSDFKTGEMLTITCKVEVVGTSMRQRQGGKDRDELELQITEMAIDSKKKKKEKAEEKHLNEIAGSPED